MSTTNAPNSYNNGQPVIAGGPLDHTDFVLSAIFIALFGVVGFLIHRRLQQRYGKQFRWTTVCFSFCMARMVALGLRINAVDNPQSKGAQISAQVVLSAGTILLFVLDIQLARRVFGQLHPAKSRILFYFANGVCVLVFPILIMAITAIIQSLTTTDLTTLRNDRIVRLVSQVFFCFFAFLPIPMIVVALITPPSQVRDETLKMPATPDEEQKYAVTTRRPGEPATGFGPTPTTAGGKLANGLFIMIPAALLTFEAGVRTAQAFYLPTPGEAYPWYMSKAGWWATGIPLEWLAVLVLGLAHMPARYSDLQPVIGN